jgi:DNA repair protein RadC
MTSLKVVKHGKASGKERIYAGPEAVFLRCNDLCRMDREHFIVIHLDSQNHLIARETVAIGGLNTAHVPTREVFKGAVLNGSAALILVHNHPSGDPKPSRNDYEFTRRLKRAGALMGITILDHIIIGEYIFHSMRWQDDAWWLGMNAA